MSDPQNPFSHLRSPAPTATQTRAPATPNIPTLIPLAPAPGPTAREQQADVRAETSLGIQLGGEARAQRAEQRDISRDQRQAISDLRKEFDQGYGRSFREIEASTRQVLGIAARTDNENMPGPADIALIIAYMKTLDPTSVVREGEQANAANAGGVPETIRNYYNRITTGAKLSPELRNEFANSVLNLYESRVPVYNREVERYRNLIALEGGDPDVQGILPAPQLRPEELTLGAGDQPAGQVGRKVLGEPYVTPEDIERQNQLQAAWDSGATPEDMAALTENLGLLPPTEEQMEVMRNARENDLPLSVLPNATGQPTQLEGLLGAATQGPIGQSATGYFTGATNALTAGFAVPPEIKEFTRETAPISSFMGELTGGALATIPAIRGAQGITAGTRLAGAAPLLGETAYGALYGAGEAGPGNRVEGAIYGGLGAAALGSLANRYMPGGPGTFTGAPRTSAATRAGFTGAPVSPENIIAAGQRENIPVLTSDIFPPQGRLSQTISNLGTYTPLGTGAQRVAQQEARVGAVENILRDFGVTVDADFAADAARNLSDTKGRKLTFLTGEKDSIIQRFSGDNAVPTTNAVAAIDNQLGRLRRQNFKSLNPLIDELEDLRSSLTGPGDLTKLEANRATIFDLKGDPKLGSISSTSEKVFDSVYRALNDDIGNYIRSAGGDTAYDAWKSANTELAEMAGELAVGGLKNALNKGEFDPNTVTRMLTQQKPGDLQALSRNLSQNGRANVRSLLLQHAAQKALTPDNIVDPTRFAKEIRSLPDSFGAFFNQSDQLRLQGLVDVLNATRSAKYASQLPTTGASLEPYNALMLFFGAGGGAVSQSAGGAFAGVAAPIAAGAAFGLSRRVLESPRARDLLLRISKASESKKGQLIGRFLSYVTASIGAQAGSAMGPSPAPTEPAPSAVNIQ